MPCVLEGNELGVRIAAGLVFEYDVVCTVRVERRVQIDEVHRLVRYVPAKNVEVIAVVEEIRLQHRRSLPKEPPSTRSASESRYEAVLVVPIQELGIRPVGWPGRCQQPVARHRQILLAVVELVLQPPAD